MKVTRACRLPPLDENACSYGGWLRVARRSLDKDAANRQASFLFLGPFSSCELADQQKQAEIQAPPNSPKLLDQTPNY